MINADCMISGRGWGGGSQGALGARDGAAGARVELDGGAQGAGHGLELGFDDVVRVPPGEHPHVQRDAGAVRERLEDVPGQGTDVRPADDDVLLPGRLAGVYAVRPPGDVHGGLDQALVERHERVAEPPDAGLVAERLAQRLPQDDGDVLDGVVRVDVDVPLRLHVEVEQGVLGEAAEHVVEEPDAGGDGRPPGPVEVELDGDVRLGRGPDDTGGTAHRGSSRSGGSRSAAASRKAEVSCGVPAVTRRCPGSPTSRTRTPRSSRPCQAARASASPPNGRKLASLGTGAAPGAASSGTSRSRCSMIDGTVDSSTPWCARAARAAAWVSTDGW